MADTTNTLRIWSHVRQIAPLSKNAAGDAWFALNLAPVFVTDPAGTQPVTAALAKEIPAAVDMGMDQPPACAHRERVGAESQDVPAAQILVETPMPELTGNAANPDSGVFNDEFDATAHTKDGAAFQSISFVEAKAPSNQPVTMSEDSERDWKTYLLHASTYAVHTFLCAPDCAWFMCRTTAAERGYIVVAPSSPTLRSPPRTRHRICGSSLPQPSHLHSARTWSV